MAERTKKAPARLKKERRIAMYYRVCRGCGCNIDPGERCSCWAEKEAAPLARERPLNKELANSLPAKQQNVKPDRKRAAYG
jgi:hypothetical protein